jgi:hypothetical protein
MKSFLTLALLLFTGVPVQAGFILYEGDFNGVFPEGSDLYSISGAWVVKVDDTPPVSGISGSGTKNGVVMSVSYEVKTPSPGGPIPIPYPDTSGPIVVNCDINPGSCVLDPDLAGCESEPNGCILQSVTLNYSFGELDGLIFGENGILLLDGALTGFGVQALYQADRTLSSFAYAIAKDGDEVPSIIYAENYSGSFRQIPESTTLALMALGLAIIGYRRVRSKKSV